MSISAPTPRAMRRTVDCAATAPESGDPFAAAVWAAPTLAALDGLNRAIWARWAEGALDDDRAQALASLAAAQRGALKGVVAAAPSASSATPGRPPLPRHRFPAPRKPHRPDRAASLARRRRLAASGPMPPALAARFTTGELAALKIVADEIALRSDCRLTLGAIAARAGVSETTARNALRAARRDGLLSIEERPRRGLPNLTNIVRMVSREWREWLARRSRTGEGAKSRSARVESLIQPTSKRDGYRTSGAARTIPAPLPDRSPPPESRNAPG